MKAEHSQTEIARIVGVDKIHDLPQGAPGSEA
jgi:hypothetical protein